MHCLNSSEEHFVDGIPTCAKTTFVTFGTDPPPAPAGKFFINLYSSAEGPLWINKLIYPTPEEQEAMVERIIRG